MNYRKVLRLKLLLCILLLFALVGAIYLRVEIGPVVGLSGDSGTKAYTGEAVIETGALNEKEINRSNPDVILPEEGSASKQKEGVHNPKETPTNYTFIRVLLTNPEGGYYFDKVKLELCGKTYAFSEKQIKKRGVVRLQTIQPKERIRLLSKDGEPLAEYRGAIILRAKEQGITLVNQLKLEEYLYQVVPSEMPASFPKEALKAQAVLARTYGAGYVKNPALPEFYADLDDTTSFQVYGKQGENPITNEVVEETEGMVLGANKKPTGELTKTTFTPAQIYYYAASCGVTTTTEAWFQKKNPLERSVYMAPDNQLAISVSKEGKGAGNKDMASYLKTEEGFAQFIGQVPENAYEKENPWFRWSYETQMSGKQLMERVRARYQVKPNQFLSRKKNSRWYVLGELEELGNLENIRVTRRAPGGCVSEIELKGSKADIRVRTEYAVRYVLCNPEAEVVLQDGTVKKMETILPSAFFSLSCGKQKKDVVGYKLVGGGFGHGIGMSQNGAAGMAEQGMNYGQILTFFYPGYDIIDIHRMEEQ